MQGAISGLISWQFNHQAAASFIVVLQVLRIACLHDLEAEDDKVFLCSPLEPQP